MQDNATDMTVTTDEIARVATDPEVKARSLSLVRKKFGHIFGHASGSEIHEIAEDALNTVTLELLNKCVEKGRPLPLVGQQEDAGILSHPVARYLIRGVSNYCNTRLRRWSTENEEGQVGARARYYIDSGRDDSADDANFWNKHLIHECTMDSVDQARVDGLLRTSGVSGEDIELIKRNLAGWSFVDLAEVYGGTADKYRRRIHRALDKAGIDASLLQ